MSTLSFLKKCPSDLGDSLRLEVRMSGSLTRGDFLPRLQLTPNNTHLDLFLDNKTSLFAHSRFYLVADVVNDVYPLKLTQESTIDDEYTPGVFKTFRFGAADTKDVDDGRYAAWKPVRDGAGEMVAKCKCTQVFYFALKLAALGFVFLPL